MSCGILEMGREVYKENGIEKFEMQVGVNSDTLL